MISDHMEESLILMKDEIGLSLDDIVFFTINKRSVLWILELKPMKNIDGNIDIGDKWKLMTIFRGLFLKIDGADITGRVGEMFIKSLTGMFPQTYTLQSF